MPRVYVSSHDIDRAREAAAACEEAGYGVISTWHLGAGPLKPRGEMTADEMTNKSRSNAHQIGISDVLLLIASDGPVPGGKFVEAGIAIGRGRRVVVWGRRENILMFHPTVGAADDLPAVVRLIAAAPAPTGDA